MNKHFITQLLSRKIDAVGLIEQNLTSHQTH